MSEPSAPTRPVIVEEAEEVAPPPVEEGSDAGGSAPPPKSDYERQARELFERFRLDIDPEKIDETVRELGERVRALVDQGRYTKVRVLYKGKPLAPDIPMGLFLAGEVASFWWAGPLRAVVMNLGVKSFVEVVLVHEADGVVRQGVELFMNGEVEDAEARYREALRMKPGDTAALYNLGVLLRVTGRKDEALKALQQAAKDEEHPDGAKARETLGRMQR
ncbi:tetratricopeptide repeat protein [Myxococcota bacterium]|nr:tetratricopeptide repeat protein [Myxococcota bacterium]